MLRIRDRGRTEGRTGGHLRHSLSPSLPPPSSVTRSFTQEALELHYPLLTADEKGVDAARPSDTTIPVLAVLQAISHNCHRVSVSAEHAWHINTHASNSTQQLVTVCDGCLGVAWMCTRSSAALLFPCNRPCLKSAQITLNELHHRECFLLPNRAACLTVVKYDSKCYAAVKATYFFLNAGCSHGSI